MDKLIIITLIVSILIAGYVTYDAISKGYGVTVLIIGITVGLGLLLTIFKLSKEDNYTNNLKDEATE